MSSRWPRSPTRAAARCNAGGSDLPGLAGRLRRRDAEAEGLAHEAAALGRRLGLPAADAYRIGQLSRIYWKQGRLSELDDDIAGAVVRFPGLVTLRCMRALASATAGRRADAAAEIEALADGTFAALPRDSLYLASLAILAEAAVTCRITDAAKKILAELTPNAARNLIQGVPVGWGAAAWYMRACSGCSGGTPKPPPPRPRHSGCTVSGGRPGWAIRSPCSAGRPRPLREATVETEVITLLSSGRENAEIAAVLGVSVHTVERHVANIFIKIGVRNRAEATAWAHRHGLAP